MAPRLKIGVIGAGNWGAQHAHVFATLPATHLVAVCDRDEVKANALTVEYGAGAAYTDHRELLADDTIDAVGIATPDNTHTPLILDALAAGKHVLCEKPLATTFEEAEQIERAVANSLCVLMVDFHNRVNPVIAAARERIAESAIGRPIHASARLSNTTFVPLEMLPWAAESSALWFLGSHVVDALRFILDDEVIRVFAMKAAGALAAKGVDTEDVHLSMLEFSKGTIVSMENSWVLSPDNPQVFDFRIDLVGETGQIQLNPSHNAAYAELTGAGTKYQDMLGATLTGPGRVGGFVRESIARFVDAILTDAPPLASARDGLRATKILTAIENSASTGEPVDVVY